MIPPDKTSKDSKDAAEHAVQRFDGAWVDNRQIKLEVVPRRSESRASPDIWCGSLLCPKMQKCMNTLQN